MKKKKIDLGNRNQGDGITNEKITLDLHATIATLLIILIVSYIICIIGGILFDWTMYKVWEPLLPGFVWPATLGGFLIGLIWIVGYNFYLGILIVFPYNYYVRR